MRNRISNNNHTNVKYMHRLTGHMCLQTSVKIHMQCNLWKTLIFRRPGRLFLNEESFRRFYMTWWHDQRHFQLFRDQGLLDLYIFASHVCYALYMTMSTLFACMWHDLSSHILTIHFYIYTETTRICTESIFSGTLFEKCTHVIVWLNRHDRCIFTVLHF